MKVICDYCNETEYGNVPELIDKGWNRAVIRKPIRKTITSCSNQKCMEKMNNEVGKILKIKKVNG